jgi:signal transduction histidine kinase
MASAVECIRKHEHDIVRLWYDEAGRAASARGLERPELTHVMPSYVSSLAAAGDLGTAAPDRVKPLEARLVSRMREGVAIAEIVEEVLLVGLCVERACAAEIDGPKEVERLWEELHHAAAALTETFAKHYAAHFDALNKEVQELRTERDRRERFVSVLAHDLRGPLGAAKIALQLLTMSAGGNGDTRRQELLRRIDRNLGRTDRMIRDLLDANRIRAGERLPLTIERCDLARLAREAADESMPVVGDRITIAGEPRLIGFWSGEEIRRSLWNLIMNAAKYGAPEGPITITVGRTRERAEISVHNEGAPIPAEEQPELFRPFARARSTRTKGGWGLGLALVRGCAEAHGGRVSVKSDPSGTTFTIELPFDARPFQMQDPCSGAGCTTVEDPLT